MRLLTAVSGVRVPQQAPNEPLKTSGFFVVFIGTGHPHLWCTALPLTLLSAVDARRLAISRCPSPSTGAKTNHSTEWFFCCFHRDWTPTPLVYGLAVDTASRSGRSVYLCVHTHCLSSKVHTCKPWVDTLQSASWLYVMLLFCII